jgi:hypothetical protein
MACFADGRPLVEPGRRQMVKGVPDRVENSKVSRAGCHAPRVGAAAEGVVGRWKLLHTGGGKA